VLPFPVELLRFLERSTPLEISEPVVGAAPTPAVAPAAQNGSQVVAAADPQTVRELEKTEHTGGPVSLGRSKLPAGQTAAAQTPPGASITSPRETAGPPDADWTFRWLC
jgi:hypothetical protein